MTSIAVSLESRVPLRQFRTPFLVAFAAAALAAGVGRAVTTSYLPLLLERIDDAPGLIGMVMLVNAAAGMAVPLVTGIWSDRLQASGRGRRMPFIVGGSLVTAGGLLALALGFSTSYLVLALSAAVVYTGLNALTTAHRALIPETFDDTERARATSAQELAMLGGGLVGLIAGGLLFGIAPWAPFALSAVLVPLLAWPTISRVREPEASEDEAARDSYTATYYLRTMRRPGVGAFLAAQILWVLGYAALPAFFLLYAEDVLSLEPGVASLWLAGFGLATGVAIAAAGRVRNPALHRPLLLLGVVLLGGGFLGVAASTTLPLVGAALVVGAAGFGLVSTLGFPIFSKLIPPGEAGGYTALYFSVRSISSTIALPAAGWTVAATGSYRALFVLGGVATLTALVPLAGSRPRLRGRGRIAIALLATIPVLGLLVAQTSAHRLDESLFRTINDLGPGPELLWTILDPHTRNYVLLIVLGLVAAALSSPRRIPGVLARVVGSALLAWGLLGAVYAVYDRPRPEEVLSLDLDGHSWAHLNSFPSGHMAITAALAVSIALLFPRLRAPLYVYVGAVAFTRVMFGAHFPLDVLAGTALGIASALLVAVAVERLGGRTAQVAAADPLPEDATVVGVMPSYNDVPPRALVESTLAHVDRLVLVDDGSDPDVADALDGFAGERVEIVRLPTRGGKGSAVRAGVEHVRAEADAVIVIDADAQHPADAIPEFVAAGQGAELVIGDRLDDLRDMPGHRRLANRATRRLFQLRTGSAVRDTQNGMRLIRGRALDLLPGGGFEAETRHLRRALRADVAVAWVPIPAIYGECESSFRTGRDSLRVLWALVQPAG